jgi:hypothetical protein
MADHKTSVGLEVVSAVDDLYRTPNGVLRQRSVSPSPNCECGPCNTRYLARTRYDFYVAAQDAREHSGF